MQVAQGASSADRPATIKSVKVGESRAQFVGELRLQLRLREPAIQALLAKSQGYGGSFCKTGFRFGKRFSPMDDMTGTKMHLHLPFVYFTILD